ncbi:MAG TPA: hypothetical protein VHZ24_21085 [Pirellulales bacterium]|jgi:HEPN domain-containing protein|nr:hypothetical protein [Pirellulales bacterium]
MPIPRILLRSPDNAMAVAKQRLGTAKFLAESNNKSVYHDAINLAVFAAECALKAVILIQTADQETREDIEQTYFRGDQGHDLEDLRALLAKGVTLGEADNKLVVTHPVPTSAVKDEIAILADWHYQSRYQALRKSQNDARRHVRTAELVMRWSEERLHGHVS